MSDYTEYTCDPWRLRAVHLTNQKIDGWAEIYPDGIAEDVFIWFVGRTEEDQWFAHGITDFHDEDGASRVADSIDGERMDVLLTFGGYDWDEIEGSNIADLAQLQRAFAMGISAAYWKDLLKMGKTELEELRSSEEQAIHRRHGFN